MVSHRLAQSLLSSQPRSIQFLRTRGPLHRSEPKQFWRQGNHHHRPSIRYISTHARSQHQRTKATLAADAFRPNSFLDRWQRFLYKPRTLAIPRWITPRHFQITATECFGHVSFCLVAISYAVDDFLLLRMIAVRSLENTSRSFSLCR